MRLLLLLGDDHAADDHEDEQPLGSYTSVIDICIHFRAVATATDLGNREKLLQAAVSCLRDKGYANTRARDLVAVSGTNLASIGYHFGGMEALMNEAVAETTRAWTRSIEAEVWKDATEHPAEHLRRMLAATIDRFDELEPYLRSFVEAFPPALRSDDLRESMANAYDEVRTAGEVILERIFEGADPPVAPEHRRALSSLLIALCDGLILQWLLDREAVPDGQAMLAALAAVVPGYARGLPA